MSEQADRHLIILPLESWGHARPLCPLVARIVHARPVTITFFTTLAMHDKIEVELTRNFEPEKSSLREHVRLVALPSNTTNPLDIGVFSASFAEAYQKLTSGLPVTCVKTGTTFKGVPAPDAALLDMFSFPLLSVIRGPGTKPIKTYCWAPCAGYAAYSLIFLSSQDPEGLTARERIDRIAAESGQSVEEVATQIFDGVQGRVAKIPGLPPMYDYERYPQEMIINISLGGMFHLAAIQFLNDCDGIVVSAPACIEPKEALTSFESWLAKTSRKMYAVGPLFPPAESLHAAEHEKKLSGDAVAIDDFMESALKSHGPKSVFLISFGSFFWSKQPEKIWAVLDVLVERNVPFILSHGSPFAVIPEEVSAKVKAFGLGLLTRWAPQQAILAHPAAGWFITHCGFNSIIESVGAGVPMICWPYQADQFMNAAHVTDNLDIAYELIEVRTGENGLKPIYRTGRKPIGTIDAVREEMNAVLDKALGEDGKKKRANVEKLREAVLAAWEENGPSRQALQSFAEAL